MTNVFSTIAALRLQKGAPDTVVRVLGYYASEDGGGGEFFWDATSTTPDDAGLVIQVTNVSTGRWKRIVNGSELRLQWFGSKQNTSGSYINANADANNLAFERVFNIFQNNPGRFDSLYIPAIGNQMFCCRKVMPRGTTIRIRGDKGKTMLGFNGTAGIWCDAANVTGKITIEDMLVRDIMDNGAWGGLHTSYTHDFKGPDFSRPGLFLNVPFTLKNLQISEFKGDGIMVYGNENDNNTYPATNPMAFWDTEKSPQAGWTTLANGVSTGRPPSKVNNWRIYGGFSEYNMGNGIAVYGPSANGGMCVMTQFRSNGLWGIKDGSGKGNVYIGNQIAYQTAQYSMSRRGCKRTVNGTAYWFICRQDNINEQPVVTNGVAVESPYWRPFGFNVVSGMTEWSATTCYLGVGAYTAGRDHWVGIVGRNAKPYGNGIEKNTPGSPNPAGTVAAYTPLDATCTNSLSLFVDDATTPQRYHKYSCPENNSLFLGLYCETGQISSILGGKSVSIGGTQETVVEAGGNFISAVGGRTNQLFLDATTGYMWGNHLATFNMSDNDLSLDSSRKLLIKPSGGVAMGANNVLSYHISASTSNPNKHIWGVPSLTVGNVGDVDYINYETGEKFQMHNGNLRIAEGGVLLNDPTSASAKRLFVRNVRPIAGTWSKGDLVLNGNPGSGNTAVGWRCLTAGTPGTWDTWNL